MIKQAAQLTENLPRLILVMGVSGCGKSTLATNLAAELHGVFVEADDFHSEENIANMKAGKPLTDQQREPWIKKLIAHVSQILECQQSVVMSFSGLKRAYRQPFYQLQARVFGVHLEGSQSIVAHRLKKRLGHFFPDTLLQSQYDTLEPLQADEPAANVMLEHSPQRQVQQVLKHIRSTSKKY